MKKKRYKKTGIEHPWGTPEYMRAYNALYFYTGRNKVVRREKIENQWKHGFSNKTIFEHNGEYYMITEIAIEQLPIRHETLMCYIKWHIVPKPIYYRNDIAWLNKYGRGSRVRYLSQTQIELMKKVFKKTRKRQITRNEASRFLYENWTKHEKNLGDFGNDGVYSKRGND